MIQTWLPLPDFATSMQALYTDDLRVQRLHILELLEIFHEVPEDQSALPDTYNRHDEVDEDHQLYRMWYGHESQLAELGLVACEIYVERCADLIEDPLYEKIIFHLECSVADEADLTKPAWFGDVDFHMSHQAALVKHRNSYRMTFRVNPADHPLIWPVSTHVP